MLTIYDGYGRVIHRSSAEAATPLPDGQLPPDSLWIDVCRGTEAEIAAIEAAIGFRLPSAARLAEIEASSRQSVQNHALVMSSPVLVYVDEHLQTIPVGFVVTPERLITLRSGDHKAFVDAAARLEARPARSPETSLGLILTLFDAIVDRMADGMEAVGGELERISRQIYGKSGSMAIERRPNVREKRLQVVLQTVGRNGETTSQIRDSLLGVSRLLAFLAANAGTALSPAHQHQLDTLRQDVASLNDYETRLTDKVQFLLDSTLGLISMEQNRTFKLLTIISVIGIPPTFIVGLYGMNFKNMPEYDWSFGYQWGLLLVVTSIVAPTVWLKVKGWF